MKSKLFLIVLGALVALLVGLIPSKPAQADMPAESCLNLAQAKDTMVQNLADSEISLSGYLWQDACTAEFYSDNPASPYYNPTEIIKSYDSDNSGTYRVYIPQSGTIMGFISQGYFGGISGQYAICSAGTAKFYQQAGGGMGYGNHQSCSTISQ
jgi:hypothetical protein